MHEVARVVDRHDHHHEAAQQVDRCQAARHRTSRPRNAGVDPDLGRLGHGRGKGHRVKHAGTVLLVWFHAKIQKRHFP